MFFSRSKFAILLRGGSSLFRLIKLPGLITLAFGLTIVAIAIPRAYLVSPDPTFLVVDRHQRFVAEISGQPDQGYGYWPIKDWPKRVIDATLAREDRRFWQHFGVDVTAIMRAFYQNISAGRRISGASTIAMQVARMQSPAKRSYFNKAIEIATAIILTVKYDREEILKHYLRLVPYGNQIYGISYAAERYFSKTVADLSWAEIAMLAAIPQSPTLNNPLRVTGIIRSRIRAERILLKLNQEFLISDAQYQLAIIQLQSLVFPHLKPRQPSAMHSILKIKQQLLEDKSAWPNHKIQTTLDLKLQARAQALAAEYKTQWQVSGADNVAVVVLNTETSEVLAWLGSSDYFDPQGGAIDYVQKQRSSGSTLKPFIYALALANEDITAATLLPDLVAVAHGTSNSDNRFLGPMLPRRALANSRNVPAVNLIRRIGIEKSYQFLQELGLHNGHVSATHYGAGLAIGAMPVTLESLVQAYGVLANDGNLKALRWFNKKPDVAADNVLDSNVARQISLFLADPQARLPSFPRMGTVEYNFPVAVKTGTSQGYRDAWTIAFTKQYTVGVWVGRSDAKPMRQLGGAASAAQLAQTLMKNLTKGQNDKNKLQLAIPGGYESVTLCSYTGKLANDQCHQTTNEWVDPERLPAQDDSFENLWVDRRNGLLAAQWTPKHQLENRQFVNLPAIYQPWGKSKGLIPSPRNYSALDSKDSNFNHELGNKSQLQAQNRNADINIKILSPQDNLHVTKLPEVPSSLNSLAFHLELSKTVDQVLWYVDNKPYQTTTFPYTLRWPLKVGEHRFQAELPYYGVKSEVVKIWVN